MYRRTPYRRYGSKYSNETTFVNISLDEPVNAGNSFPADTGGNLGVDIINPTNVLGNRKVKNFTIKLTATNFTGPIVGVLVYVPEGTVPNPLSMGSLANKLYEPNQNVICNFVIPTSTLSQASTATVSVRSSLARNLNSNDRIVLICGCPNGSAATDQAPALLSGTVNFSIK